MTQPGQALVMRGSGSGGAVKVVLALLLVAGVGGGAGYYFLVMKPQVAAPVKVAQPSAPPPVPAPIHAALARWELRYLDLSGSSMDRLEAGSKLLAKDQRYAYAEAEESFQQALLLDPSSDAAIAGYVQAVALGRGTSVDKNTFDEALSLIEAAEERSGRTALMLLAHANLLMCRPTETSQVEQARQLAEEALSKGTDLDKGEAHLVLGRAYLQTSMGLANQHFDEALVLSPNLQRVQYHRALAEEGSGAYSLALEALKGRLQKDPEHWDSMVTMARIYLEVGEVEQARKLYEARAKAQPNDVRVLLALAVLRYQVDGNAAGAAKELRAILKNRQRYLDRDVAEVLVHLAAAERMAGNVDAGVKAAEEAAGLVKGLPAAHLQLFLAALARGDVAKAAAQLPAIQGKLEDTALEKVLEGRLRLAEKKPAEALELFHDAYKLDPRREDAMLLAGIAAAQAGHRDDAFRIFFQALQSDPMRLTPRPVTTVYFLRPGETLAGMAGSIQALSTGKDDVGASLYEGLLLVHIGDKAGAERLFKEVFELDPNNAGAAAYLSLLALQRGDGNKARTFAARAVTTGRQMPIAHLANGLALAQAKQLEPAKHSLRDALALAPGMLSAETKLDELDLTAHPDEARQRLVKVAGLDPTYFPAKRLLFMTDQRR
jgi:Tfp pilus assembly protein PilF